MTYNQETHHRQSIRLPYFDYSQPGYYFITICTKNRECLLGNIINNKIKLSEIGKIVKQCWLDMPKHYPNVELDEFIVMPNHLHGIIIINDPINKYRRGGVTPPLPMENKIPLGKIVAYFKYQSTKQINKLTHAPGQMIWQRNYYEHIIRNEKKLERIRYYIGNNPYNWQTDRNNPENLRCR